MKRIKVLAVSLVLIFAIGCLTACGKVEKPTKNDVIDALIDEKYLTEEETDVERFGVSIEKNKLNGDEDRATVECVVTTPNGSLNKKTTYKVTFKLRDDKSWKCREVEKVSTKEELAAGITDEDAKEILAYQRILAGENNVYFSNEKTVYEIGSHETDLEAKTDKVTVTGSTETAYKTIKFEVVFTFTYSSYWNVTSSEVVSFSEDYIESYKLEPTAEQVIADLKGKDLSLTILDTRYYFTSAGVNVSDIKVEKSQLDRNTGYVPVTFTINMSDVAATVEAKLYYYYSNSVWAFRSISEWKLVSYKCNAIGKWVGTDGDNKVTITITDEIYNSRYLKAEVTGVAANGDEYKYSAYIDEYEPDNSYMSVQAETWVQRPATADVDMETYNGYYASNKFTPSYSWNKWSFEKQGASTDADKNETATETPTETQTSTEASTEASTEGTTAAN